MHHQPTPPSGSTKRTLIAPLLTLAMLAVYIAPASAQVTPPPTATEDQKVVADNAGLGDQFGFSVDVDDDTMVVGARFANGTGTNQGSAYIFIRSGDSWTQQAELPAPDAADFDHYGQSVGIDGDTVVIGSPLDNDPVPNQGSAYVFVRSGTTWTQQAKLTATTPTAQALLGQSIAIDGDTIAAGAPGQGDTSTSAAYVFTRTGTTWTQQAELAPAAGVGIGQTIDVDGDTMVLGAPQGGINGALGALTGSAYVFARTGTTWTQQANLIPSDPTIGDQFGWSVAVDGTTIVAGARFDDLGSAYVFTRTGNTWSEEAKLIADDGVTGDQLGFSVDIDGDAIVAGADLADGIAQEQGAAYFYTRTGSTWTQQTKLTATNPAGSDRFATSISLSNGTVVAGAPLEDDGAVSDTADRGSAYVLSVDALRSLGDLVPLYADTDGDTFGDPNSSILRPTIEVGGVVVPPTPPAGFVANRADCNDLSNAVFPGASEIGGDAIDQDCNGDDAPAPPCNGLEVTVNLAFGEVPTSGNDVIMGTAGDDIINAGDGRDTICAGAGNDTINAGNGADTVFGGSGDDIINAGQGRDTVHAQGGNDVVSGGKGKDTLIGGGGNDTLRGNEGTDTIDGGAGNDELRGGQKADSLKGGSGNDALFGGIIRDLLDGGTGLDTYNGGGGLDTCLVDPDGLAETNTNCELQ